ncbi:MAG: two-component regulator propeller domain-containing protein, partial [Bacteroidota bacterium]
MCAFLTGGLLASPPGKRFRHISKRQGLSQNSVFAIAQDQHGFMWFGTRDGLNRYDGYQIRVFHHQDSLPHSVVGDDVRSLYYDSLSQSIWICTATGLSQYQESLDRFHSYTFLDSTQNSEMRFVRCIIRGSDQTLWVGTDSGLFYLDEERDAFVETPAFQGHEVLCLATLKKGPLWVGTRQGLFRFTPTSPSQVEPLALGQTPTEIRALQLDRSGDLWIGTHKEGLYRYSEQAGQITHFTHKPEDPYSITHNTIRTLQVSPKGDIWVGTFLGLNIWEQGKKGFTRIYQTPGQPQGLNNNSIRSIFFDSRGSAWVGTYYGGVSYHNPVASSFMNYRAGRAPDHISHSIVSSFIEDASGSLWIGTEGGGLNYWNRQTQSFQHFRQRENQQPGLSGNNVKTLYQTGDSLWIGCYLTGLDLFLPNQNRWQHIGQEQGLSNQNVYSLLRQEQNLWIATYGGGLNIMDMSSGQIKVFQHDPHQKNSVCSNRTRILMEDSKGRIWLGTDDGLDLALPGPEGIAFQHFLEGVTVYSLVESRQGILWVGTYRQGVYGLDPLTGQILHQYNETNGLPGHTIFGMLEDELNRIWISTESGLARLHLRDQSISSYTYSDGLGQTEFNFNAYYKLASGEMFFGGTEGFVSFFPNSIRTNTFIPPLVLTGLTSFNQLISPGDATGLLSQSINHTERLTFAYNRANFSLSFAALDFQNPDNNRYRYRLKGLEE